MKRTKQLINVVLIIFCVCFISCKDKKTNATESLIETVNSEHITDNVKTEETEQDASWNNEPDNFQGVYVFSKTEVLEYKNIDISEYTDFDETFDETAYIRMKRTGEGKYDLDTNVGFILVCYPDGINDMIEYPSERWNRFNSNKIFHDRFFQIAADGPTGGVYVDFFYTGTEIVLDYLKWDHKNEEGYEEERIGCYIYFSKVE